MADLVVATNVATFVEDAADTVTVDLDNLNKQEREKFLALFAKVVVHVTAINLP